MVDWIRHVWPSATLEHMVFGTFVVYLLSILCFACFYYFVNRSFATRLNTAEQGHPPFFFVPDIARIQTNRLATEMRERLAALSAKIRAAAEARDLLAAGAIPSLPATLPSGNCITISTEIVREGPEHAYEVSDLLILDPNELIICDLRALPDANPRTEHLVARLGDSLREWTGSRAREEDRLSRLDTDQSTGLRFLDFVYFSAGTQSTAGYGDILPASTRVRLLAVVQVVWGIFLFVVVLNILLSGTG